jgi:hypothetical protein
LEKTSGSTQGGNPGNRQIGGMIFFNELSTMNFNLTWNTSAAKSNLTRLQAGDSGWLHSEDRRFGKTCWQGWQPPRLRFECDTDELETENEP